MLWLIKIKILLKRKLEPKGQWEQVIHYISNNQTLPAPLTNEQEQALIERLAKGEKEAKQALIEHNLRLVIYIARKYESSNNLNNTEDLISIGTIGLIKAINTYNPEKNIKLATYASRCIENEILMHLRHQNRRKQEISLDEPLNIDHDGNELLISDIIGTQGDIIYETIEKDINKNLLEYAMTTLSERERVIIQMRYGLSNGLEQTQKQVAQALGISQSYISRLEKKIIRRLRKELQKIQ